MAQRGGKGGVEFHFQPQRSQDLAATVLVLACAFPASAVHHFYVQASGAVLILLRSSEGQHIVPVTTPSIVLDCSNGRLHDKKTAGGHAGPRRFSGSGSLALVSASPPRPHPSCTLFCCTIPLLSLVDVRVLICKATSYPNY